MQTRIVILAAGKGTRMGGDLPKVLIPFEGKPMIVHLLDTIRKSGVDARPIIVVGHYAEKIKSVLGDGYDYAYQPEQLGTGHAVACAETLLRGKADRVIVLYGDHPFVKASTIVHLLALHERADCPLSLMTVRVEDFNDWRAPFADFGRIARDASGKITAIVEARDATPAEQAIREINPAFFCFDAAWLWQHLPLIANDNTRKEYYLTDLISIAIAEGACVASLSISPEESIGINTPEHLEILKRLSEKPIF